MTGNLAGTECLKQMFVGSRFLRNFDLAPQSLARASGKGRPLIHIIRIALGSAP